MAVNGFDFTSRLSELTMPSLVVAGEHDVLLPACRRLAEELPKAALEVMPHLGHMAPFEDPHQFAHILISHFGLDSSGVEQ
jgi:pimeloyl-ACP methyl ester carboxylesterase